MRDIFEETREVDESNSLLGYPCSPEIKKEVLAYIQGLSDEEHSFFCEWVPYGVDGALITAEDIVIDQRARLKRGDGERTESEAVKQVDDRLNWIRFIDESERIAFLEPFEPEDGIGEGDMSNLRWIMLDGGKSDFAFHCQLEVASRALETWKKYMLGQTGMRWLLESVFQRMEVVGENNTPERIREWEDEFVAKLTGLMTKMLPAIQGLEPLLEGLGATDELEQVGDFRIVAEALTST